MEVRSMIYGVVSIRVKAGKRDEFVQLFKSNAAVVKKEKGCFRYMLTTDVDSGMPIQLMDKDVLTILEEWQNMEDVNNHLATPHMAAYFEKEKDLVDEVVLRTLQEV
jgi:quinol monooxygenase YgiN